VQEIQERRLTPDSYEPKEKTCLKCAKHDVCVIYRYAVRFLQSEFPSERADEPINGPGTEKQPFKAEETAKICRFYNPLQKIEALTG
jgi:hypothetical protein